MKNSSRASTNLLSFQADDLLLPGGSSSAADAVDDTGLDELLLTGVDFEASPFDDWTRDVDRALDEFGHLPEDLFSDAEKEKESGGDDQEEVGNRCLWGNFAG